MQLLDAPVPDEQRRARVLGQRHVQLRKLRVHAAVDRACVRLRLVASVPGELHVPQWSVRVRSVQVHVAVGGT